VVDRNRQLRLPDVARPAARRGACLSRWWKP